MPTLNGDRRSGSRLLEAARASRWNVPLIVLQAVAAIAIVAWVTTQQGLSVPFLSGGRYVITAHFADADGLDASRKPVVTVAGVIKGTVTGVRYQDGKAVATLDLSSSAEGRVFANATALITPRSAINDLTVDIQPGSPGAGVLRAGLTIPESRTKSAVNLDKLTDVLNVDTRAQLAVMIDELGIGVHDRSRSLDQAIQELHPLLDSTDRLAAEMRDRQRLLSQLVSNLNVVFTALGQRGSQLREVIQGGQTTLSTVAARQRDLQTSLRELAPALTNTTSAFDAVTQLSSNLSPALRELVPAARALPAGLTALRRFVPTGLGLATDLSTLDREAPAGTSALAALLNQLAPTATGLLPSVQKLLPVVQGLDRYPSGIGDLGSHFSGIFSGQNGNGPTLRAYGFFEPISPENFGLPARTRGAALAHANRAVADVLDELCTSNVAFACLARELTPKLPGIVVSKQGKLR